MIRGFKNMLTISEAKVILTLIFTLVAGFDDYKDRRIRNELSFSFLVFSLYFCIIIDPYDMKYILWKLSLIFLLVILYMLGTIGGGDFKILLASLLVSRNSIFLASLILALLFAVVMSQYRKTNEIPLLSLYAPIYLSISIVFTLV